MDPPQNESFSLGYYLWLVAIGAIVYAYVFATSRDEMENTTLDPTTTNEATNTRIPNTGHRVITLLPFVWLYAVLTKVYTSFAIEHAGNQWFTLGNLFLTLGTLVGLVFVSIGATQSNDPDAGMNITGSERTGWFTTNIVLMGIIALLFPLRSAWVHFRVAGGNFFNTFSGFLAKMSQFVFSFWFPFMMMVYFVKTGATDWFRIVAVVSIVIAIGYNLYNLYNMTNVPLKPWITTGLESLKYFLATSPIMSYFKFVETNDLVDVVAKRVLIFALLCYVAYLMISVYKFKNSLVPCVSTNFESCFWNPNFKQTGYDPRKTRLT